MHKEVFAQWVTTKRGVTFAQKKQRKWKNLTTN